MPNFKLHNKSNGEDLVYPSVGLWNSPDIEEARDMRDALRKHCFYNGWEFLMNLIVIKNMETDEEIE